jgi:hypothetical protein
MKQDNLKNNDPQLKQLLGEWQVNEPLPPRFQQRVWQRIEDAEAPVTRESMSWFAALFMRPAFATAAATLLLLAGLTTGYLRANHDAARMDAQLAHRYIASVNPYAADHR